jgi:cytochrome c oxidase assembly protein subunit 15
VVCRPRIVTSGVGQNLKLASEYSDHVTSPAVSRSGKVFRYVTQAALASLCVIIVTGALVRLTGSGLGCEDWPRCNEQKLIDVSTHHTRIEQLNRLFTGVVSLSVVVAVLGAYRRKSVEPRLVRWAWSLVIGVIAQVVLGGIVVLTGLHPLANMGHFLLSMVLVTCGWVLVQLARRSESDDHTPVSVIRPLNDVVLSRLRWALSLLGLAAIVSGTVVTASGPHAGDENAPRFDFALSSVARVHGLIVIATIAVVVALLLMTSRRAGDAEARQLRESVTVVGWCAVAQAGVGYWQYFTGVPAGLVLVHIAGATALWLSVCNVVISPRAVVPRVS